MDQDTAIAWDDAGRLDARFGMENLERQSACDTQRGLAGMASRHSVEAFDVAQDGGLGDQLSGQGFHHPGIPPERDHVGD